MAVRAFIGEELAPHELFRRFGVFLCDEILPEREGDRAAALRTCGFLVVMVGHGATP